MKFELKNILRTLDDYTLVVYEEAYSQGKQQIGIKEEPTSTAKIYDKRAELESLIEGHKTLQALEMTFSNLIESLEIMRNVIKTDLEKLRQHNSKEPAYYSLDSCYQYLCNFIEVYKQKIT